MFEGSFRKILITTYADTRPKFRRPTPHRQPCIVGPFGAVCWAFITYMALFLPSQVVSSLGYEMQHCRTRHQTGPRVPRLNLFSRLDRRRVKPVTRAPHYQWRTSRFLVVDVYRFPFRNGIDTSRGSRFTSSHVFN